MQAPEEAINLTKEEIDSLLKQELSHGTDGRVMRFDRNRMIKLYHKYINWFKGQYHLNRENDDDMKTYNMGDYKKKSDIFDMFTFYVSEDNGEFIRIRNGAAAVASARERQLKVKNTRLPQSAVFIDGKFIGCTLIAIKGIQIHKLIGLPFSLKKKIMKKVLYNVKELMDNYIYHVDLDNSPFTKDNYFINEEGKLENVGHSHVLINPITFKPQLIDLDGKSTVYTDACSKKLENQSMMSFNRLMIEFLLGIDLDEYKNEEDLTYILSQIGIDVEYIDLLATNSMNYEQAEDFLNNIDHVRRI